jgi:Ca2+-binding EF-hand superfamily protein
MAVWTSALCAALAWAGPAIAQEQSQMASRFRALDRNGDGVVTRDEWRGADRAFRNHDWNGDGVLSGDEVRAGRQAPDSPSGEHIAWTEEQFQQLDRNHDGRLSRHEWNFDQARFDRADHDGNGQVTRSEFLGGVDMDDEPAGLRFERLDANADNRITRDEWRSSLESFNARDVNQDGVLTRRELEEDLTGLAVGTTGETRVESRAYRAGYARGLNEGRQAGRGDRASNTGWDLEGQRELEQADAGYRPELGDRRDYQDGYRAGFRTGYPQGYYERRYQ